jgi:hypothetical protein
MTKILKKILDVLSYNIDKIHNNTAIYCYPDGTH